MDLFIGLYLTQVNFVALEFIKKKRYNIKNSFVVLQYIKRILLGWRSRLIGALHANRAIVEDSLIYIKLCVLFKLNK